MVKNSRIVLSSVLIVAAVGLLIPIYNLPVWWVSLEAPNYPEESFPDGVRILFHVNGVFNGCEMTDKTEIQEDEALDCVHEMDTINHYVGMYPIASGGPVELSFSIFLLALIGVMVLGFACVRPTIRLGLMSVGFVAIAIWMGMTFYSAGGLKYHNADYLAGRISVLGESADEVTEPAEEALSPGAALIARLEASLAESEAAAQETTTSEAAAHDPVEQGAADTETEPAAALDEKARSIEYLREAFVEHQKRRAAPAQEWRGNGAQLLAWHYEKSLGRYFNDPEKLAPMVTKMAKAGHVVFWAIIGVMAALLVFARKPRGLFNWLLVLIPATLPGLFVLEYSIWLGWYGHNMSDMGAFTLKPFMPTVFGQGKVAQFTTNSYPDIGFWLMVLFAVLLLVAAHLRRQTDHDTD